MQEIRIAGALLLLTVVCLATSTLGMAELESDMITDLAGQSFAYWHSPDYVNQFNDSVYIPHYGVNFAVARKELNLYDYDQPIISVLWVTEANKKIVIDVIGDMYDRINESGGDVQKATFGTVEIGGIAWHTAQAPKRDGTGVSYVAMIAYTNGEKTATLMLDETRPKLDNDGFKKTLNYVKFKTGSGKVGMPLQYY
jgi:hypothetical protein